MPDSGGMMSWNVENADDINENPLLQSSRSSRCYRRIGMETRIPFSLIQKLK
jgi:hypothetical protein